jgi:YebC/PmpR family DNA-binding regulatory protein
MGKSWKNAGIAANNAKKGAAFTKHARELQVAAKMGGPDPLSNSRLRIAIDEAREASVPKDTIERAIRKGAGLDADASQIEEITYEGYGPHKVGVIVECLSDNDGQMGAEGSVGWMFDRVALIEGKFKDGSSVDAEGEAIEAGANEVEDNEDGTFSFYGAPTDLKIMEQALAGRGWKIIKAELSYKAKNHTELSAEQRKDVIDFLQALDENDDVSKLHTTLGA